MDPRERTQTFSGILRAHLPEQRPLHVAALTNKMAGLGRTCLRQRSAASCRRRCERIVRGRGRELTGGAERGAERGAESTAEISAERAAIGPARMWRTVRWARWTLRGRAQQQRKRRPAGVTIRCLSTRRGKSAPAAQCVPACRSVQPSRCGMGCLPTPHHESELACNTLEISSLTTTGSWF